MVGGLSCYQVLGIIISIAVIGNCLLAKRVVKKAKVMHEYKAEHADELSLEVGQVVEILKQVVIH